MIEEIQRNLFRLRIPLPDTPLKYLNAYLVRAAGKSLLIDTGFKHDACLKAMMNGLSEIGVGLDQLDILITHFHADHFCLAPTLATERTQIWFNRPEAEILESWEGFGEMLAYAGANGFPQNDLKKALDAHPGSNFGSDWMPEFEFLSDGRKITYGDYCFTCIETPGHTLGHICLYEAGKRILVSGDHILIDITPNIQCWSDRSNPLESYLASLTKVYALDVDLVLPGHRRLFKDHRRRIDELRRHHDQRLSEVMQILASGDKNAYQTAAQMTWDIKADCWDEFPVAQKWFAMGEAIAHLRCLEERGRVKSSTNGGIKRYAPLE